MNDNNQNDNIETLEGDWEENPDTALQAVNRPSTDLMLGTASAHEALKYRADGLYALRRASIKALNSNDFHRFGDNWWLLSSGVSKITEIYGIHYGAPKFYKEWKDRYDEEAKETVKNSHYIIKCELSALFPMDGNRSYTTTGSASTRDPFFMRNKEHPHPLNVDEENVRKKAETNARARCLIGLGIANFTPDELKEAGLKTQATSGHDYKKAAPSSEPSDKQWGMLKKLIKEKIPNAPDGLFTWLENEKPSRKEASYLIDWMMRYSDGDMDYDEQFKAEYKRALKGELKSKEEK